MAVNFPDHPADNDTFVNGAVTYKWDGSKWTVVGSSGGGSGGGTFTGGTLTTPLILAADPTDPLGAVTKQYADAHAGGGSYTLPAAAIGTRGGVQPDGVTTLMTGDVISAVTTAAPPLATTSVAGLVKPDGTTTTVDGLGVLHSNTSYTLPIATVSTVGGVKPDNLSVLVSPTGVISATTGAPPVASTTVSGTVKVDGSSVTMTNGVLSAKGAAALNVPNSVNTMVATPDPLDYLMMFDASANAVMWLPLNVGSDGIGDLAGAAPVADGTLFWANQGGAADVSVTAAQLAAYTRAQSLATVALNADTVLNYAQHNGRRLYAATPGITISVPTGAGALQDGFSARLTNISGGTIGLGASITLLPGVNSTVANGVAIELSTSTAGGTGSVTYATQSGGGSTITSPNTPTGLSLASHSPNALQVTWVAPSGPAPTSYTVQYQVSGASSWTQVTGVGATNYQITGLTGSTTYVIEVAAANLGGTSPFTVPLTATTDASLSAPGVPTSFVNSARGNTTLAVTWAPPASGGTVSTYNVIFVPHSGGTPTSVAVSGTVFSYTYTGLTAATGYDLSITATNGTGTSSAATLTNVLTTNLPAQVTGLSSTAHTSSNVTLGWTTASGATSYHIQYRTDPAGTWNDYATEPTSTSQLVGGLSSGTTYDFQVAGKNSDGLGAYSSIVAQATTSAATATVTAPLGQVMVSVDAPGVVVTFANTSTVYAVPWTGSADVGTRVAVTSSGSTVAGLDFASAIGTAIATIRVYSALTGGALLAESTAFTVVPYSSTRIFNSNGSITWNPPLSGDPGFAPAGTQVTFEAWGAGSGGGGNGGGGGAYAKKVYTLVTADITNGIAIVVGNGSSGTAHGTAGVAGGNTTVTGASGTIVMAQGGQATQAANGLTLGGGAASSIGTVKFSGGAGANSSNGAGGGGSAGKDGAGASGVAAGGSADATLGGAGAPASPAGSPGVSNVEGGGGGGRSNSAPTPGGLGGSPGGGGGGNTQTGGAGSAGGDGQVRISYTPSV